MVLHRDGPVERLGAAVADLAVVVVVALEAERLRRPDRRGLDRVRPAAVDDRAAEVEPGREVRDGLRGLRLARPRKELGLLVVAEVALRDGAAHAHAHVRVAPGGVAGERDRVDHRGVGRAGRLGRGRRRPALATVTGVGVDRPARAAGVVVPAGRGGAGAVAALAAASADPARRRGGRGRGGVAVGCAVAAGDDDEREEEHDRERNAARGIPHGLAS